MIKGQEVAELEISRPQSDLSKGALPGLDKENVLKKDALIPCELKFFKELEDYEEILESQKEDLQKKILNPESPQVLYLLEHKNIYTTGRGSPFQKILEPKLKDTPWIEVSRGGEATWHGAGQIVAYPVFDLKNYGSDVHVYLRKLEGVILLLLKRFGLEGERREGLTGIWLKDIEDNWRKIASIGVGIKRWVSYHGISININNELDAFKAISPCGLNGEEMTTLYSELQARELDVPEKKEVYSALATCFSKVFKLNIKNSEDLSHDNYFMPPWLKASPQKAEDFSKTRDVVDSLRLTTVCEEARCPNIGECWSHSTATFMIMGENCTRRCGFCSVKDGWRGDNLQALDPLEPYRVAQAVKKLDLEHVVITSVNRDDLEDMGAEHFSSVVKNIHKHSAKTNIELLIPDMRGDGELLETILQSGLVSVLNHNIETVPRLYKRVRPGSKFERSLKILRLASKHPKVKAKSGFMLGLGERREEILELLGHLKENNVDIVTIGQYLRPTKKQLPVERYVTPDEFSEIKEIAMKMGFSHVESAPLVRSSYHAWSHLQEGS